MRAAVALRNVVCEGQNVLVVAIVPPHCDLNDDVVALAEELEAGAAARRFPEDPLILSRYQRRRIGPNLAMMGMMESFKRGFGEQSLAVRWLRNVGLSSVNRYGPLRKALARKALGI